MIVFPKQSKCNAYKSSPAFVLKSIASKFIVTTTTLMIMMNDSAVRSSSLESLNFNHNNHHIIRQNYYALASSPHKSNHCHHYHHIIKTSARSWFSSAILVCSKCNCFCTTTSFSCTWFLPVGFTTFGSTTLVASRHLWRE